MDGSSALSAQQQRELRGDHGRLRFRALLPASVRNDLVLLQGFQRLMSHTGRADKDNLELFKQGIFLWPPA